jgi:hypothetical protein
MVATVTFIGTSFDGVGTKFDVIDNTVAAGFNTVTAGFETVTAGLDVVDKSMKTYHDNVIGRFDGVTGRFDGIDGTVKAGFDTVTAGFDTVTEQFDLVDTSMRTYHDNVIGRFDDATGRFDGIEATLVPPSYNILGKFAGCDGIDQNDNSISDECAEDRFPPSIFLPDHLPLVIPCLHKPALCLDKYFKSEDDAKEFLESVLQVTDDCATTEDLSLSIEVVDGSMCEDTTFAVTPKQECKDPAGIFDRTAEGQFPLLGKSLEFVIGVDATAPEINCGFAGTDGKVLRILEDNSSNLAATSFYYDIQVGLA